MVPRSVSIGISVVIYCISVSAVPIYNKLVFSGVRVGTGTNTQHLRKYPYPIATAFLQLGFVAICLFLGSVAGHVLRSDRPGATAERGQQDSWVLGPHLRYKLRHVAPVGILFGLKYGVTNWGLQLLPVGLHLLLQSTDLLWTVAAARCLNREQPGLFEYMAVVLSSVGSVMIAMHAVQTIEAPVVPLLVNLLTPLMLALCIATLRMGAKELFRPDNRLAGTVTPTEFTALKLVLSSLTALALAMLLEHGGAGLDFAPAKAPWWIALGAQPWEGVLAILFGGIFVLIFQVNLTWLAGLTSAMTVGIVGGMKVVPQWLLNELFNLRVNLSPLNIGGASFILLSSILYTWSCSRKEVLVLTSQGIKWRARSQSELRVGSRKEGHQEALLPAEEPDLCGSLALRTDSLLDIPPSLLRVATSSSA